MRDIVLLNSQVSRYVKLLVKFSIEELNRSQTWKKKFTWRAHEPQCSIYSCVIYCQATICKVLAKDKRPITSWIIVDRSWIIDSFPDPI